MSWEQTRYVSQSEEKVAINRVVEHLKVGMDLPFYEDASDPSTKNSTRRKPPIKAGTQGLIDKSAPQRPDP